MASAGGTTNSVIEYCLSFNNSGPGMLVCQFADNVMPTRNNTVRFSVSIYDGQASLNGATGLNFFSPDNTLTHTHAYGNTFISTDSWALVAPAPGSAPFAYTLIERNALVAMATAPQLSFELGALDGLNFSGNAYWSVAGTLAYDWNGAVYTSLAAFREVGVMCDVMCCDVVLCRALDRRQAQTARPPAPMPTRSLLWGHSSRPASRG